MIAYFAVTFAVFFLLGLIAFLIYASPGAKKRTSIPGPPPSDKESGNFGDIAQAGGLHNYLCDLHEEHGSIVGFYFGQTFVVSLASKALFRQTARLFDRPPVLFEMFAPVIGTKSIQFANGAEGRQRRAVHDRAFSHEAVAGMMPVLADCGQELCDKLADMARAGQHVPLMRYAVGLSVKAVLRAVLEPDVSKLTDAHVAKVHRWYDLLFVEMEKRLNGEPINDTRQRTFDSALSELHEFIDGIIAVRRGMMFEADDQKLLIDMMIDLHGEGKEADETVRSDVITYFIAAFHTSGTLLAWTLYHLILHPEYAEAIREEVASVVGQNGELNLATIGQLKVTRSCLDESMRVSCLAPYTARVLDADSDFDGFPVPAGTPLLLAQSVVYNCPIAFENPERYWPQRPLEDFQPYGWGRRKCPGYRLANAELVLWLAQIVTRFDLVLADSEYRAAQHFGVVTRPVDEIWAVAKIREDD